MPPMHRQSGAEHSCLGGRRCSPTHVAASDNPLTMGISRALCLNTDVAGGFRYKSEPKEVRLKRESFKADDRSGANP